VGDAQKVFLAEDTGDSFRWDGTKYVRISERVASTGIEDSSVVGRAVVVAADEVAARAAISAEGTANKGAPSGYAPLDAAAKVPLTNLPARTMVDLRDFPDVQAANWSTFLGGSINSGSTTVTNTSFTSADVGKVVMALVDNTTSPYTWWKTSIVSVSGTTAEMSTPAPVTLGPVRFRYGFDASTAINAALAQINANAEAPTDVYLGGSYAATQIVIPGKIRLHGVSWSLNATNQGGSPSKTVITQLPGAEKSLIVFEPSFDTWVAFSGLHNLTLNGPEINVSGLAAGTVGHGVEFATAAGAPLSIADGFTISDVVANNFPGSGFRCYGAIPLYVDRCKGLHNGRYGFELDPYGGLQTHALHIRDFSADWNNLGAIGCIDLSSGDSVFITGVKSEGHVPGAEADAFRGGPNYQSCCIVLNRCHADAVVMVNGVSHLRVARAGIAPGPAITVSDTSGQGRKPSLSFTGVKVRLDGTETGPLDDAVVLKDETLTPVLRVPRTVRSGRYPTQSAFRSYADPVYDANGNKILDFVGIANATSNLTIYNNANAAPIIAASQFNSGIGLSPNGIGSVQIGGSSPRISSSTTNGNLNLVGNNTGVVQHNGIQVEVKGHTHVAGDVTGAAAWVAIPATQVSPGTPGQMAYDAVNNFLYVCVAANSWRRTAIAGW
jgi:hypothetical protein